MKSRPLGLMAIALVGLAVVGSATPARALDVTYTTLGTFDSGTAAGTNVFNNGAGVMITFEDILAQTVGVSPPPASLLSFGNFNTTGTTAPVTGIASGFTLQIFQAVPSPTNPASLQLIGTLQGTLGFNSSTAFVQFTGFTPATLPGIGSAGFIGTFDTPTGTGTTSVSYYITEADNGILGKANIVSPTVNNGISSVEGAITSTTTAIPEPSTIVMGVMAIVPLGLVMYRRRAKGHVAG